MKTIKLTLLVLFSLTLITACGEESTTTPSTPIDKDLGNDGTDGNNGDGNNVSTNTFALKAKKMETFKIHDDLHCNNPNNKRKLNQQQRAKKFQKLCQRAAPKAEKRLFRKCNDLGGILSQVRLESFTSRSKFGFCRSLHCQIKAFGTCSVSQ